VRVPVSVPVSVPVPIPTLLNKTPPKKKKKKKKKFNVINDMSCVELPVPKAFLVLCFFCCCGRYRFFCRYRNSNLNVPLSLCNLVTCNSVSRYRNRKLLIPNVALVIVKKKVIRKTRMWVGCRYY
jgi:hypothetical protein